MIPKRIIYCWFGEKEKPKEVKKCIATWKQYMPDWEYLEINENNFDINQFDYTKTAYKAKKWAYVSDVARIWALNKYGGIYLDTDVEVFQSFEKLLNNKFFIGFEQQYYLGTATIGSQENYFLLNEILSEYSIKQFQIHENWQDYETGPMIVTNVLEKYINRNLFDIQKTENLSIYSKKYFTNHQELDDEVYCKHHMFGSWG